MSGFLLWQCAGKAFECIVLEQNMITARERQSTLQCEFAIAAVCIDHMPVHVINLFWLCPSCLFKLSVNGHEVAFVFVQRRTHSRQL